MIPIHVYMYIYICIYIYIFVHRYVCIYTQICISLYVSTPHGSGLSRTLLREIRRPRGSFFEFGSFFIDQMVWGSRSCDGSQPAGSNTAIESFWRRIFAEIWPFLWCYVRDLVCVMCSLQSVLCAGFSLSYVQSFVCVMCSL